MGVHLLSMFLSQTKTEKKKLKTQFLQESQNIKAEQEWNLPLTV